MTNVQKKSNWIRCALGELGCVFVITPWDGTHLNRGGPLTKRLVGFGRAPSCTRFIYFLFIISFRISEGEGESSRVSGGLASVLTRGRKGRAFYRMADDDYNDVDMGWTLSNISSPWLISTLIWLVYSAHVLFFDILIVLVFGSNQFRKCS